MTQPKPKPMTVNNIISAPETILATRQWFADNARACIDSATTGEFHVNDLDKWVATLNHEIMASLRGENDHTLAFMQRALYIQTGECVALLS